MSTVCRYYEYFYERGLENGAPFFGHMAHWLRYLIENCGYIPS